MKAFYIPVVNVRDIEHPTRSRETPKPFDVLALFVFSQLEFPNVPEATPLQTMLSSYRHAS